MLRDEGNDDELDEVVGAFEDADVELVVVFVDEFDKETNGELVVLPIVILRTGFLATWLGWLAFDSINRGMDNVDDNDESLLFWFGIVLWEGVGVAFWDVVVEDEEDEEAWLFV